MPMMSSGVDIISSSGFEIGIPMIASAAPPARETAIAV